MLHPVLVLAVTGGSSAYRSLAPLLGTRLLTAWSFDPIAAAGLLLAVAIYGTGVVRLHLRGDSWPLGRTVAFAAGLFVVAYAVLGPFGSYDDALFSDHMAQHMALSMLAPIGLALGAPITLALRTLPLRPRRWLLVALHSRLARLLTFPVFTVGLFLLSVPAYIWTPMYLYSEQHLWFHELVHLHFLLVGCLLLWPLIGVDPLPNRPPYWERLLILLVLLPFHAFIGLALMASTHAIAGGYYAALHLPAWAGTPLSDTHTGGAILWGAGDPVALALAVAITAQWMRSEDRLAVREDRARDRPGTDLAEAEAAWNDRFAQLARQDARYPLHR